MRKGTYYKKGEHNVLCDVCGCVMKSGQTRKRWDGMIVCPMDFETRHPNDFPPPINRKEGRGVKDPRPEPETDTFQDVATGTYNFTWEQVSLEWDKIEINWEDM